jgi:hypothetical protein
MGWKPIDLNTVPIRSRGVYLDAYVPEHPFADRRGRVLLHRLIVENKVGRYLTAAEIVHHDNENPRDNDPDNLLIKSAQEHSAHHHPRVKRVELKCLNCGSSVYRRPKQIKNENVFCDRRCRGLYSLGHTFGGCAPRERKTPHGSAGDYRAGCRCDLCKASHARKMREWRLRLKRRLG